MPALKVIVTSRAVLHVYGEHDFAVPPLTLPAQRPVPPMDQLMRYEGIRLFIERVKVAKAAFALTEGNASAVTEICHRVDGLPLAIELAAASVRLLPPEGILERLEHRLPLLTRGARDLPARQQTLRRTIAWSHDLLSEDEQRLFRGLTVFVGGCTVAAAESVCRPERGPATDVLEAVGGLMDKSLLRQVEGIDGELRLQMLETIRDFGQEELQRSGEAGALRRRHAEYFRTFIEQADPLLRGSGTVQWLDRLEAEHDNLLAALAWSLEAGDPDLGLRLAGSLAWFWRLRGHVGQGCHWLRAVLAASGEVRTPLRVRVLNGLGLLTYTRGEPENPVLEESLALARELGDRPGLAWALHAMGRAALARHDLERAAALMAESLTLFRAPGDVVGCAYASWDLGNVAVDRGEHARAAAHYEQSLSLATQAEDTWAIASALLNAANLPRQLRQYERAMAMLGESLEHYRTLRGTWGICIVLAMMAVVAAERGQAERAARLFGAEQALRDATGSTMNVRWREVRERGLEAARRALPEGIFAVTWAEGHAMTREQAIAYALEEPSEPPHAGHTPP